MSKPAHIAGEQTGKHTNQRREDQQEGDGPRPAPRAEGGDDEEE